MKNPHDIIQKNSETFEKDFVVRHETADPVVRYTDAIKIKQFLLSSQLSIIQAIDEWAEKNKYPKRSTVDELGRHVEPSEAFEIAKERGFNSALSDLRSFLKEAKTKLK